MFTIFHHKEEVITRNYDVTGVGYSAVLAKPQNRDDSKKSLWSVGLVKSLLALFASVFFSALGYGILAVMIAFRLEESVKNEILISISVAVQIGAGVLFSRFLPSFEHRLGMINSIYFSSIISAICAILLIFYPGYLLWLTLVYILGTSFFISGITRNTMMINMAPPHFRALMISIGGMIVAIGNGLGPVLLNIFKMSEGPGPLFLASAFYIISVIPLSRLRHYEVEIPNEKRIGLWRYIKQSPKIMLAGFTANYAISSANAFLIIYGLKVGITKGEASLLYTVLLFGTIFSIPLGYLTDFLNRRFMMMLFAAISMLVVIAIYVNNNLEVTYFLLFIMFGALVGMKLPAVVLINEKYKPTQRLAVNSAFARFALIGNIFGIFCTGFIIKLTGPQGLWLSIILMLVIFLVFCVGNYTRKILRNQINLRKISFFNKRIINEQYSEI